MNKLLSLIISILATSCCNNSDLKYTPRETNQQDKIIHLRSEYVLRNVQLFNFIDSFLVRCGELGYDTASLDNRNIFMLFIYQNDFFTRVKISYTPSETYQQENISLGTGYFEYKRQIFILVTGLDRLCQIDSTLINQLQEIYGQGFISKDSKGINSLMTKGLGSTITWEADITRDTIIINGGTINPLDPPPSDTAILYHYIRSIKSFDPKVDLFVR